MAVRTVTLAAGSTNPVNVEHVVYTCPPGRTAICKDVRIESNGAVGQAYLLLVRSGPIRVSLIGEALTAGQIRAMQPWVVLEPGDQLRVFANTASFSFWISGTELEGVAP